MPNIAHETHDLLRLLLTPGLGPVTIARLIEHFGSAAAVASAPASALSEVRGIGRSGANRIVAGIRDSERAANNELKKARKLRVRLIASTDPEYPPLLREIHDAPPLLFVRGRLDPGDLDRYPVAVVGSRSCTHYGLEQAGRFASALAEAGLTIVSGGARGVDTAAHRGALRTRGRTIAVMGCGLAHTYPPDNADLFERIVDNHGALISELPLDTAPGPQQFPARNRIISGMSLGTLVIEAGKRSGSLITARLASEDHNREVFVLPGRVDSRASEGSIELLKMGAAAPVSCPDDCIAGLESAARHLFDGSHHARFSPRASELSGSDPFDHAAPDLRTQSLTDPQRQIIEALSEPRTMDDLLSITGLDAGPLRAELTMLEIRKCITRTATHLARA